MNPKFIWNDIYLLFFTLLCIICGFLNLFSEIHHLLWRCGYYVWCSMKWPYCLASKILFYNYSKWKFTHAHEELSEKLGNVKMRLEIWIIFKGLYWNSIFHFGMKERSVLIKLLFSDFYYMLLTSHEMFINNIETVETVKISYSCWT